MDPNEALERLREIAELVFSGRDRSGRRLEPTELVELGEESVETFSVLDSWITGGGLLPEDW